MSASADLWLWIARATTLHGHTLRDALAACAPGATPDAALAALLSLPGPRLRELGLPPAAARHLARFDARQVEADRSWLERHGWSVLSCLDARFPPLLTEIADPPTVLFVRGELASLCDPQLAMVGSRHPSAIGRDNAAAFARHFSRAGLSVTSGLAIGIDAVSHEAALVGPGRTLAVLGHGPDLLYPPENRTLAERLLAAGGALLSEFPPGTPAWRGNFPRRNRLISGLSLGTLVVEAARHSGSLVTARAAAGQGRAVFAIPGSIHNPMTRGCHELIREGARLVESADDVWSELNLPYIKQQLVSQTDAVQSPPHERGSLDKGHKILLDALDFEPASIDSLVDRTGLPSQSVASMLLILELEGKVGLHPGGRYVRLC